MDVKAFGTIDGANTAFAIGDKVFRFLTLLHILRQLTYVTSHITSADGGKGRRFVLILTFVIFFMGNNSNLADEGGGRLKWPKNC